MTVALGVAALVGAIARLALGSDSPPALVMFLGPPTVVWLWLVLGRRWAAVRVAHDANRGGGLDRRSHAALAGARIGDWPPEASVLIPVTTVGTVVYALITGDYAGSWWEIVLIAVIMCAFTAAVTSLYWARSPWFRVRWYLMRAQWSRRQSRERLLQLALVHDPQSVSEGDDGSR